MILILKIGKLLVIGKKVMRIEIVVMEKITKKKKIVNLTTSFSARYLRWVLIDQLNLLNVRFSLMLLA